jgi:hypothetical protein
MFNYTQSIYPRHSKHGFDPRDEYLPWAQRELFLRQDGKSLVLNPSPLTPDQEQVLRSCLTTSKIYNRNTLSMDPILTMNTYHERNGKLFLRQIPATNSALNGNYV